MFRNLGDSNDGALIPCTISGNTISFGSTITFTGDEIMMNEDGSGAVFDPTSKHIALVYLHILVAATICMELQVVLLLVLLQTISQQKTILVLQQKQLLMEQLEKSLFLVELIQDKLVLQQLKHTMSKMMDHYQQQQILHL